MGKIKVSTCETGSTSSSNFSVMSMLSDKRERRHAPIGTNTVAWKVVARLVAASPAEAAVDTEGSAVTALTMVATKGKSMATVVDLADERPTFPALNVVEINSRSTTKVMTSSLHEPPDRPPPRHEQHQASRPKRQLPSPKNRSRTCLILATNPLPATRPERHQPRTTISGFCRAAPLPPIKTTMTTLTTSNLQPLRPLSRRAILWQRSHHHHRQRRRPHQAHSLPLPHHWLRETVPISTTFSPRHLPPLRIRRRYCHR